MIQNPNVECWEYTFSQSATDTLYMAVYKEDRNRVLTEGVGRMWKYLIAGETIDGLMADIKTVFPDSEYDEIQVVPVSLSDILSNWRLVRFNGRRVCANGCAGFTPDHCNAYPAGPIAPVVNGWLYYATYEGEPVLKDVTMGEDTDSPIHTSFPVVASSLSDLVETVADLRKVDYELLLNEQYQIIAVNPVTLANTHPVIWFANRPFPLLPVMNLNPTLHPDNEEELLQNLNG
jgi:hypothetical protein